MPHGWMFQLQLLYNTHFTAISVANGKAHNGYFLSLFVLTRTCEVCMVVYEQLGGVEKGLR